MPGEISTNRLSACRPTKARTGPGGALEALLEARDQGIIGHIGCTAHTSRDLIASLEVFDFEVILVPMNLVERDPLAELIPLCQARGVGVTIMKPVATGLLPATLALKWLLNQPIASAVPGTPRLAARRILCSRQRKPQPSRRSASDWSTHAAGYAAYVSHAQKASLSLARWAPMSCTTTTARWALKRSGPSPGPAQRSRATWRRG